MAVVVTKSAAITSRDATPRVFANAIVAGAVLKETVGTVETANGDSIGSTYILCSVPSNARMSELRLHSDDIGATTIADFGIYRTTEDGGAVVDADLFGSAVSLKDGAVAGTDILHESAVIGVEDAEQPLWQAAGLSADPMCMYDIVATLTAAADAAGTITVKARYV